MNFHPSDQAPGSHDNDCSLCREFTGHRSGTNFDKFCGGVGMLTRELVRTDFAVVIPTLGALVPGHVLVCSTSHDLSWGASILRAPNVVGEINALLSTLKRELELEFGYSVTVFEHGPARLGTSVGCSTDHAHFHILPMERSVEPFKFMPQAIAWRQVPDWTAISEYVGGNYGYLLWANDAGTWVGNIHDEIPRQFLRRQAAALLGLNQGVWDWRSDPQVSRLVDTSRRLAHRLIMNDKHSLSHDG